MRPQCTACGNYLMPCTATATGVHPRVVDATTGRVVKGYEVRYRDGYYVVIDTETEEVVPPPVGHYKRHRDGYLWGDAARHMADQYEREGLHKYNTAASTDEPTGVRP